MSSPKHTLTATCTVCDGKFSMADDDFGPVMDAYNAWDARHKHADLSAPSLTNTEGETRP